MTSDSIAEIGQDVRSALADAVSSSRRALGLVSATGPVDTLLAIEATVRRHRTDASPYGDDEVVGLGALLGEQYVRHRGWRWVQFAPPTGPFGVISPDGAVGIQPLHLIDALAGSPDREIALVLAWNMVGAGDVPASGGRTTIIS